MISIHLSVAIKIKGAASNGCMLLKPRRLMKIYQDFSCWPFDIRDKSPFFIFPKSALQKWDEKVVTYALISDRRLFGMVYSLLLPEYFESMPQESGVMIGSFVKTQKITKSIKYPGDIDILIIPYEGSRLVLSKILAIEIKVIRATFQKQNKSPNQFGFSQANALLKAGFPYVAVGHLIVSANSPKDAWREVGETVLLDSTTGQCAPIRTIKYDMLPSDLLGRAHGRLEHNCDNSLIGHFSAYPLGKKTWLPMGKSAELNPMVSMELIEDVSNFYLKNYNQFLWTRRYSSSVLRKRPETKDLMKHLIEKMRNDF